MKDNNAKLFYFIFLFFLHSCTYAQSTENKLQIAVTAGLDSNYAYDVEFSSHYLLLPYLGVGGGIGYFNQWYSDYLPSGEIPNGQWNSWALSKSDEKIGKVYLRPSILLRTPTLLKQGKCNIFFQVEPGMQLLIPYTRLDIDYVNSNTYDSKSEYKSTSKGEWCFWNFKSSINLKVGDMSIGLGYGISNLDIYASRRNIYVEGTSLGTFYPKKSLTHSYFINLAHSF